MLTRRLASVAIAIAGVAILSVMMAPSIAQQDYPNKPIRLIVPFPPGGITDGSARVIADRLGTRTGMNLVHVPYKGGGPAIIDVDGGQIPLAGTGVVSAIQQVRQGSVKAIGVGSPNRDPALPNVPNFAELIRTDLVKWGNVIREAGIKAE